jgi:hypothetical protein
MHDCQRFREDWIAGLTEDAADCADCSSFCEDSRLILEAIDGAAQPVPELPEAYWNHFDDRLRNGLVRTNTWRTYQFYWKWSAVASVAAAIIAVITWGAMRPPQPVADVANATPEFEFVDDHIKGLNPTVVTFLGQSELFLRSFTKIDPEIEEDFQDAQLRAKEDLAEIETQKSRAADFAPVRVALDEYENFLREIKNVDSAMEITEIQNRISGSGLIANMKAYQPQATLVIGHRQRL